MVGRPSQTAMVAGRAPSARTTASAWRAVSRLSGQGRPWAIRVDSRATTGCPARKATATGGRTSSKGVWIMAANSERDACRPWSSRNGDDFLLLRVQPDRGLRAGRDPIDHLQERLRPGLDDV